MTAIFLLSRRNSTIVEIVKQLIEQKMVEAEELYISTVSAKVEVEYGDSWATEGLLWLIAARYLCR